MSRFAVLLLTTLAMLAFAGNSLLCRAALDKTAIDPASFTAIRIVSGALMLLIIARAQGNNAVNSGSWRSALALFAYAAGFAFAYLSLSAATGALLLFGSVQATMIGWGLLKGERLSALQWLGLWAALGGLVCLLLPGLSAPPAIGSSLMISAGIAWGIYSLRGRGPHDATAATGGNFLRATPFALALGLFSLPWLNLDSAGTIYAIASGALTSGVGYAVWFTALGGLSATSAATVQLSVPVIATAGGVLLLGEQPSLRLVIASVAILGGIAVVILGRNRAA